MKIKVAGAQIPVTLSISENCESVKRAIDFAAYNKADILLTPEGSVSGYTHLFDQLQTEDAIAEICEMAAEHQLGLALGTCFTESDAKCYDQLRFYDKDGSFLGFHSKILTCGIGVPPIGEVQHFSTAPLHSFQFKGITCGGLICNDMWANPVYTPIPDTHLSQKLSSMGVRIIFHGVNGGRDGTEFSKIVTWNYHDSNLRMRAKAGNLYVVTADNCHPTALPCSAPSGVVSPEGQRLIGCPEQGEHCFVYDIVID